MIDDLMTCHLLLYDLSPPTPQPCAASGRLIITIVIVAYYCVVSIIYYVLFNN